MTQKQLIIEYCRERGNITPAKMYGFIYRGQMLGSELSRRCRELRKEGRLESNGQGKFKVYSLKEIPMREVAVKDFNGNIEKVIKLPI